MKLLILVLIALFCSVGVALLVREDPGYVLVAVGPWTIETSVAVLVVGLAVTFFIAYKLVRYLSQIWALPRTARRMNERRRMRKAHDLMNDGLAKLTAGDFRTAERKLAKAARYDHQPTVSLLGAARAAEALGDYSRRNGYLLEAKRLGGHGGGTAVALTRTDFEINHGERERALEELAQLRASNPRNPEVLARLKALYLESEDWDGLYAILPDLRRVGMLAPNDYQALERRVVLGRFSKHARKADLETLRRLWKEVPRSLRSDPELLIEYATQLETQNAGAEAEKLIRKAILSKWDHKLVLAYGELTRCDAELQLRNATSWLRGHEHDARLLLTLGRLARRNHLWDKARGYLEESVKISPSPDACQELGSLLEQLDEPESAKLSYRRGLQLLTGKVVASTTPVLEAPADSKVNESSDEAKSAAEPQAAKSG